MESSLQPRHITVLGNGSWATALVKILSEQHVYIHWWLRKQADVEHLLRYSRNPRYLSMAQLNLKKIIPTTNLAQAIAASDIVLVAIPSAFVEDALSELPPDAFEGKRLITSVKGMMPERHCTVTEYLADVFQVQAERLAIIAGPCHAEEVAMERQSYLTVASPNQDWAKELAKLLSCHYINACVSTDLHGIEYCAVLKNIFAIACGLAKGLSYGDNYQAVLVSNATQEAKRFLDTAFPLLRDLNASAYLGDILVTTYSQFSRNRMLGNMVGRGYSVKIAQVEMGMVAEGYYAVKSIMLRKKEHQVAMPITEAVYNVLYEKISPIIEFRLLSEKLS
jgi:glycerol-3-phosphate dehydrogenase (NAD(P)+)